MVKRRNNTDRVTYRQLSRALIALGFVRKDTATLIVFRELQHEAMIILPFMDDTAFVGDPHLVGISNTVMYKGIATKEKFHALLRRSHETSLGKLLFLASGNSIKIKKKLRAAGRRSVTVLPHSTE